jgi:hypothetical protein
MFQHHYGMPARTRRTDRKTGTDKMADASALGLSVVALLVGITAGAVVSPPAVQAFLYDREGKMCWDPGVKLSAAALAKATAANIFKGTIPPTIPTAGRDALQSSFDVKLDDFL